MLPSMRSSFTNMHMLLSIRAMIIAITIVIIAIMMCITVVRSITITALGLLLLCKKIVHLDFDSCVEALLHT